MSRYRQLSAEERAAIKIAACQRVEAVWSWLGVLCPELALEARKELARKILDLSRGEEQKPPRIMITPAQVSSIIWPNMQCINPRCPMVLFSNEIADELNEFFKDSSMTVPLTMIHENGRERPHAGKPSTCGQYGVEARQAPGGLRSMPLVFLQGRQKT